MTPHWQVNDGYSRQPLEISGAVQAASWGKSERGDQAQGKNVFKTTGTGEEGLRRDISTFFRLLGRRFLGGLP